MPTLIAHGAGLLGLMLASVLLHGWWQGAGGQLPLAFELWLTALPGLAVGALLPSAAGGIVLAALVLGLQHLALAVLLLAAWRHLRPRPRPLPQSSSPASSPGNSTSVKPNWLKSRTRIG